VFIVDFVCFVTAWGRDVTPRSVRLLELALVFLKLGTIGFGGPAAHIALMETELVGRRRWLTRDQFLDLVGAVNLIPGPNSTEVAIHVGRVRAGLAGLIVSGTAFILPAFVVVTAIAWMYQRVGTLPETAALLYGVKPVILAIVVHALVGLARTAVKNVWLAIAGVAAFLVTLIRPSDEVVILLVMGAGAGVIAWWVSRAARTSALGITLPMLTMLVPPVMQTPIAGPVPLGSLFLVFLKIGSVLFGSGYVLLAFLRADLVERLGWLTNAQLLDAIAVGQVTPGPLFTTATFIGYNLAGVSGAVAATVGIFLPAFVFVAVSAPLIPAMRRSRVTGAVLDAVNVASVALMAAVTCTLAADALTDLLTLTIAAVSAVVLFRFRLDATFLVIAGGLLGLLFR
jgi:chromate transporter